MIAADLAAGGKGELDPAAVAELYPTDSMAHLHDFHGFVGNYLALHGQEERAVEHWKQCMDSLYTDRWNRTLAGMELTARGHKAEDFGPSPKGEETAPEETGESSSAASPQ